ncbi:hypothetical protein M2284_003707 [Rhodococcus sp. LBL1]|nr:hypothetical protein [Rhodococcus sp. LBL1]MDH6685376.1 hypothetical protein [Rhodococcus sp. LBL2]
MSVDAEEAEFIRLYGPWARRTPADTAELFSEYPGAWWISGGWALEAFTGISRPHDDVDPSILRCELPLLRRYLAGRLDLWTATSGSLKPLPPGDDPTGWADTVLPEGCGQIWTREHALAAWEYDILLSPGTSTTWVYKRDARITMPMTQAVWRKDGIAYLQPEIQLLYKAAARRAKDEVDFTSTLPFLDAGRRSWLHTALSLTSPGHPWCERILAG